jgi:hypothetical protein
MPFVWWQGDDPGMTSAWVSSEYQQHYGEMRRRFFNPDPYWHPEKHNVRLTSAARLAVSIGGLFLSAA